VASEIVLLFWFWNTECDLRWGK